MKQNNIFKIPIENLKKKDILEKIEKYIAHPSGFFHIVSLNPENIVLSEENNAFKQVIITAQIRLIDGVGVALVGRLLGVKVGERVMGADLMQDLLDLAGKDRMRVMFLGGRDDLALSLSKCYLQKCPSAKFVGTMGIRDIKNPKKEEEDRIFSIVSDFKPQLLFVAFGSPFQELWLWKHRQSLTNVICMGVGGAFDFLAGCVPRAPLFLRKIGLEWLFRLIVGPWRWRRQLRLIKFIWLVCREQFK